MNFDLTGEHKRWRDLAREFARGEIGPRAERLDREQRFPYDLIAEMSRLGLMGLTLPEEYGGSGGDFVGYNLALEEISRADTSVGITMEAHVSLGCAPLAAFGTREQKEKFLRPSACGESLWAFGLTEEEAGTDAGGTRTTAELDEDECHLVVEHGASDTLGPRGGALHRARERASASAAGRGGLSASTGPARSGP